MQKDIVIPDLGVSGQVDVIEIHVKAGQAIEEDTILLTLESDKAAMEVPAGVKGVIESLSVKLGDKVETGTVIGKLNLSLDSAPMENSAKSEAEPRDVAIKKPEPKTSPVAEPAEKPTVVSPVAESDILEANLDFEQIHAGPGVRRFARELGVDLSLITGTGPKGRILKSDVEQFVKSVMSTQRQAKGSSVGAGMSLGLEPWPKVDFAQFGEIETHSLSRIQKISGRFLHRNWVRIPHVTQFDEADITEMEAFRKAEQQKLEKTGLRLTPLVFLMKAVVSALKAFPQFNASLDDSGTQLVLKRYFHIGVAVDTPNGLVVPVIRSVDQKSLKTLAEELLGLSQKAREGKLLPQEMQGGCFSISSLGGIGGTAFTPIINAPEVAILGVSKSQLKPSFVDGTWVPRLMLPLSLSYDHRVIDGALAARFTRYLSEQLGDIRRLLL